MNLNIDIDVATEDDDVPDPDSIIGWLREVAHNQPALKHLSSSNTEDTELSVRIVNRAEIQQLNNDYRHKNSPTNVLSFPSDLPPGIPVHHLGDIVICAGVVNEEAQQQNKPSKAHWAHMIVHGLLHLLGFDHETDDQAIEMESLETVLLATMGFPAPYGPEENLRIQNL